jgi:uncharacterized protein
LFRFAGIIFLIMAAAFLSGCSSMLYYPSEELFIDTSILKHQPEDVHINLDKERLAHGWYFSAVQRPARGVVLYFHGNGENRSTHFMSMYWLIDQGYDLAIFDYPGYGPTEGSPSPKNTVEMGREALRFVHARNPGLPVIVYGQSLGGAVAMRSVWEVRNEFKPDMMIVAASFLSYRRAAKGILSGSALTWLFQPLGLVLLSDEWSPDGRLRDLAGIPLIVIHSRNDEMIPVALGKEIFEQAGEPKQLWLKNTGGHMAIFAGKEGEELRQRVLSLLPGAAAPDKTKAGKQSGLTP